MSTTPKCGYCFQVFKNWFLILEDTEVAVISLQRWLSFGSCVRHLIAIWHCVCSPLRASNFVLLFKSNYFTCPGYVKCKVKNHVTCIKLIQTIYWVLDKIEFVIRLFLGLSNHHPFIASLFCSIAHFLNFSSPCPLILSSYFTKNWFFEVMNACTSSIGSQDNKWYDLIISLNNALLDMDLRKKAHASS